MADDKKIEAWATYFADGKQDRVFWSSDSQACVREVRERASQFAGMTYKPLIVDLDWTPPYQPPQGVELPDWLDWKGEYRAPKKGEPYLTTDGCSVIAQGDHPQCQRRHILRAKQPACDAEARKLLEQAEVWSMTSENWRLSNAIGSYLKGHHATDWDAVRAEVAGVEEAKRQEAQQPQPDAAMVERVVEMIGKAVKHKFGRHNTFVIFADSSSRVTDFDDEIVKETGESSGETADWIITNQPGGDK